LVLCLLPLIGFSPYIVFDRIASLLCFLYRVVSLDLP